MEHILTLSAEKIADLRTKELEMIEVVIGRLVFRC